MLYVHIQNIQRVENDTYLYHVEVLINDRRIWEGTTQHNRSDGAAVLIGKVSEAMAREQR